MGRINQYTRARVLLVGQAMLVGLIATAGLLYFLIEADSRDLTYIVCWLDVMIFVWAFWSWKQMSGTWFDPYMLFLLSAVLFNGGHAILEVFNMNEAGILDGKFLNDTTVMALFLVGVGIAWMHLGAMLSAVMVGGRRRMLQAMLVAVHGAPEVRQIGWLLFIVSVVPLSVLMWRSFNVVLQEGYFALYQQEAGTGLMAGPQVLATFFVPAALFMLAGAGGSRLCVAVSVFLILGYSSVALFLGMRSAAIAPLTAYAWVWHRCRAEIPRWVLAAGSAILLVVVIPLVGSIRTTAGSERASAETMMSALFSVESAVVAGVSEMGGSLRTLAHTIELVPGVRPFDDGVGYLYALLTVFPNLFWDVHPSVARGTPSAWLTATVDPVIAALGGGYGYSFMAEAFLNFGYIGVPIVLFVIGLLFGRFVAWGSCSSEPLRIATLASYLAFFLIYARSDATRIVRPLIWYTLLPYLTARLLRRYRTPSA